ncbi:MAG TPA: DUF2332 family protein [Aliidongia sp.]|nr:DUF2332 family protein [Aliidongia sp.]
MSERVRLCFEQQAQWCTQLGSPFTALLCGMLAQHLDRSSAVSRRVLDWPAERNPMIDALALRLTGGLHALVRQGRLPGLAALYPPHPLPDGDELWAATAAALEMASEALMPWLDGAPQTNEIGRSALFMSGALVATAELGLPLALYELGASAGLNLLFDRYRYRLGDLEIGRTASPVVLAPAWRGAAPPKADIQVIRRCGVDLSPIDAGNEQDRERLLAYIWPDQADRLERTGAALAIAAASPPRLDRADAADWIERMLDPAPEAGTLRVVLHSIAFQYFPTETRRRIKAHLRAVGETATTAGPLAWLRFEGDAQHPGKPALKLTLWPGGAERTLATADGHAREIEWLWA